ncbi:MAG: hypothetical protein IJ184_03610 [Alphaproteobacteria bacterium]|nr:hypothetical protein [Alphaproteobacteria bacterium]
MEDRKLSAVYGIRSYEGDPQGNLRPVTLMNILQEVAVVDAAQRGFGMQFCLQHNMTWVSSDYVIEIKRMPRVNENIRVVTWPSAEDKFSACRDFCIYDAFESPIVSASSRWLLISLDKRRPQPIAGRLGENYLLSERALVTDFPKIPEVQDDAAAYDFRVRFDDIDVNRHINNAVYILWASEAVTADWRQHHEPCRIEVNFRKEGFLGEDIKVLTTMDGDRSISSIRAQGVQARELARVVITWRVL